jgi:glycosyltransferase involved in cell wall biosynthesis
LSPWYHAPPPAAHSGVADYASRLWPALSELRESPVNLYHLGNNPLHDAIYTKALAEPGVAVLHDVVLHHFLLGRLTRDQYIAEFVHNYGEWKRPLAEDLWEARASSGIDPRYFDYPLVRRAAESSRAVIVHNPGAAEIAKAHGAARVHVIPHFYQPAAVDPADAILFRQRLSIPQTAKLFGIFGYLRETKRIAASLTAFHRLRALDSNAHLLIAGEPVSADLRRMLDSCGHAEGVHRLGHLTDADLNTAAQAIDCCINLRYPAAGETSGIAIRMMGAGKPVILTRAAETSALLEHTWLGVSPGPGETEELFTQMALVAGLPQVGREIGAAAQRHIAEHHSLDRVARAYRNVLAELD